MPAKITKKDDLLWLVHPNKTVFDIFSPRGYSLANTTPIRSSLPGGSAERGTFFRLQVCEREGISLVRVY